MTEFQAADYVPIGEIAVRSNLAQVIEAAVLAETAPLKARIAELADSEELARLRCELAEAKAAILKARTAELEGALSRAEIWFSWRQRGVALGGSTQERLDDIRAVLKGSANAQD